MRMLLKDGKSKVLTLSYDDGPVQDIRLIQIFDRYGIKATFNLNSGCYLPEDVSRQKFDGRMKERRSILSISSNFFSSDSLSVRVGFSHSVFPSNTYHAKKYHVFLNRLQSWPFSYAKGYDT